MNARCPRCHRDVPEALVEVLAMEAYCAPCGKRFDFSEQLGARPQGPRRLPVDQPARFRVERPARAGTDPAAAAMPRGEVTIEWSWFGAAGVALAAVTALFWGLAVGGLTTGRAQQPTAMIALLLVAACGAILGYLALCRLLNRTRVTVTAGVLRVEHGPLPWPGHARLPTDNLMQLYVARPPRRGRRASQGYALMAVDTAGAAYPVVTTPEPQQARFLEQSIEEALGIADIPVAGELD